MQSHLRRRFNHIGALLLLAPSLAQAAPSGPNCDPGSKYWLDARVAGPGWSEGTQEAFFSQLRPFLTELRATACTDPRRPDPALASLVVQLGEDGIAELHVIDSVTQKDLRRTIDVSAYQGEALVLALTVAAEELIQASWLELLVMKRKLEEDVEPPAEVVERTESRVRENLDERDPTTFVQLGGALDAFTTGHTLWGGDLSMGYFLSRRTSVALRVGGRGALPIETDTATIDAFGITGGADVQVRVVETGRLALNVGPRLFIGQIEYRPRDVVEETTGTATWATVLSASIIPTLTLNLSRHLGLRLEGGAGIVMRGAQLTFDGEEFSRLSGGHFNTGLFLELRP